MDVYHSYATKENFDRITTEPRNVQTAPSRFSIRHRIGTGTGSVTIQTIAILRYKMIIFGPDILNFWELSYKNIWE